MNSVPLFKSHYSLGKSILTVDKPTGKIDAKSVSIIDLALHAKLKNLVLVEDNVTSIMEAGKNCQDNKLKLIFGLRLDVTNDIKGQDEASLKRRAKYVILAGNDKAYQDLIKIWSFAARDGFYYNPCIDFRNLKKFWSDELMLAIPFYDSFLHLNSLNGHGHIPEFGKIKPIVMLESNHLPFDQLLRKKAEFYANESGFDTLETSSIFYKSRLDFMAYMTFRCINERTNIEKPELDHMGSDSFNFERWMTQNG